MDPTQLRDPRKLMALLWPDVRLYDKQWQIVQSVVEKDETVCVAGNMLGKDFVSAFIVLYFFLTRHPCRVVTTSVDHAQLSGVLWGEIRRFIQTSAFPLSAEEGGPLAVNHLHLRKVYRGDVDGISYVIGRVALKGEGMLGHHVADPGDRIPRTLFVADEASGVDDKTFDAAETWANRKLIIGNPYPCANYFRRAEREGSTAHRTLVRIRGEDSPNVRLAQGQARKGEPITGEMLVPGVLPYYQYLKRRRTWDRVRQCVGIDARFYEGVETLMFPPEWLNRSETIAESLRGKPRRAVAIGVDAGEGCANTALAAVDWLGLIELESHRTKDTDRVVRLTKAFMRRHCVPPECVAFDRGGGGKQHADRMRAEGYDVGTVSFGGSVADERGGRHKDRRDETESKFAYKNRRAQMYGELREMLRRGWGVPSQYTDLLHQLSVIPLLLDPDGRLMLLPKSAPPGKPSLTQLIGRSPDEGDATAIAVHTMLHAPAEMVAGVLG